MAKLIGLLSKKKRSKFFTGIASAMADQWGDEAKLPVPVEQLSIF